MRHCKSVSGNTRCLYFLCESLSCTYPKFADEPYEVAVRVVELSECPFEEDERKRGRFFVVTPSAYEGAGGYTRHTTLEEARRVCELNRPYHSDNYVWDEMLQEVVYK